MGDQVCDVTIVDGRLHESWSKRGHFMVMFFLKIENEGVPTVVRFVFVVMIFLLVRTPNANIFK